MPEYTLKIVSKFLAFDDVEARKISKIFLNTLKESAPSLEIEVKVMQHGKTENLMKRTVLEGILGK